MTAEKLVAPGTAITADDINFGVGPANRPGQIAEEIEQAWIVRVRIAGPMVAKEIVKLCQRLGKIRVSLTVNNVEVFPRMRVIQPQAVFPRQGLRCENGLRETQNERRAQAGQDARNPVSMSCSPHDYCYRDKTLAAHRRFSPATTSGFDYSESRVARPVFGLLTGVSQLLTHVKVLTGHYSTLQIIVTPTLWGGAVLNAEKTTL
jgi:hypothetical protein